MSRPKKFCTVPECGKPHKGLGFCILHYERFRKYGDPHKVIRNPKGSGSLGNNGYKLITYKGKRLLEHRHIIEKHLKRPLKKGEVVHHIDGNKLNNEISNLELITNDNHARLHSTKYPETETHKQCRRCLDIKTKDNFYVGKRKKDGRKTTLYFCKPCHKEAQRTYRKTGRWID